MIISELMLKLDSLAPFDSALSWDNVGLLCGEPEASVSKVYLALDLTERVLTAARDAGCDLILTHHPFIFSEFKRVCGDDYTGKRIISLIRSGISAIAMHTNFDIHVMGSLAASRLPFNKTEVLEATGEDLGIGTVSELNAEMSLEELAQVVKEAFHLPYVLCYGNMEDRIKTVAMVPGSGSSDGNIAIEKGAQVLITGDVTHHRAIDFSDMGLNIIDAGHYGLEHIFIEYMEEYIKNNIPGLDVIKAPLDFPGGVV